MTRERERPVPVGGPIPSPSAWTAWNHVRAIAAIELRRRFRTIRSNLGRLLATAFTLLVFVPFVLAGLVGVFLFGAAIEAGEIETPAAWVRAAAVYGWLFVVGFGGYRAYSVALRPDNVDGLLTTVSHRELFGGLVLAEALLWGVPAVTIGVAAAAAFGLGLGAATVVPFVVLSISLVLATALATGFAVALLVRNGGVRSRLLARLRTALLAVLGIAYFGLLITGSFASVAEPLYRALAPTPIGWYADLALLGAGVDDSPLRAGGALLASAIVLVVAVPVLDRLSEWLWYADGVSIEHEESATERAESGRSRLDGLVPRPILGVLGADWKRARRAPVALSFAIYPLFVLVGPVTEAFDTGTIGSGLPLWTLLCGAWISGSLFSLNAVGAAGATLPVTLLGARPGRALVVGHALAAAAIVTPITVLAVAALAAIGPHPPAAVVTLSLSALALTAGAGFLASGVGVLFPRFEAVRVTRGTRAIVPSMFAFGVYSVLIAGIALPSLLAHSAIVGDALASAIGTSRTVVSAVGTVLSIALVVVLGGTSAALSIRRIESYHLD